MNRGCFTRAITDRSQRHCFILAIKDGPSILEHGVAGREIDVPSCVCVINYSAPNHLAAYVDARVGRTREALHSPLSTLPTKPSLLRLLFVP